MKQKASGLHLILSALPGILWWMLGEILYPALTGIVWQPLGIVLYFIGLVLVTGIALFFLALLRGDIAEKLERGNSQITQDYRSAVVGLVLLIFLTGLLEFLYEIERNDILQPTSYVFLIDDSGSMDENDPGFERVQAIGQIMEKQDKDFAYAVYRFTDVVDQVRNMSPYSADDSYSFQSYGGTDIIGALNGVVNDFETGRLSEGGTAPRILLLSDGSSSSRGLKSVLQKCHSSSITVSTIRFGSDGGERLLKRIALQTGGVYLVAENADQLYDQMSTAVASFSSRNLISERYMADGDLLYGFLRAGFLCLMGLVWAFVKANAYCGARIRSFETILVFASVCCVIAAAMTECFFRFYADGGMVRLLLCILWTIAPGEFPGRESGTGTSKRKTEGNAALKESHAESGKAEHNGTAEMVDKKRDGTGNMFLLNSSAADDTAHRLDVSLKHTHQDKGEKKK